jgi:hypothetical protein
MKTRDFTLYATILMMGAGLTAAGQPARGERSGNHENNNRSEIKAETNLSSEGQRKAKYSGDASERSRTSYQLQVNDNLKARDNSPAPGKQNAGPDKRKGTGKEIHPSNGYRDSENRSSTRNTRYSETDRRTGKNEYTDSRVEKGNRKGYVDNRAHREIPAVNHRDHNYNVWGNGKYSRHEWEHRKYSWDDRHWNFSNYYRKGHIPWYFRNNSNYWYYPGYGHILRGFRTNPVVFYAGRIPFYFEDGFFFRYHRGIGYVWVEDPLDIWFTDLPRGVEKVRIGGRMYFRFGNAYFESGPRGFRLALLPDRYYKPWDHRGIGLEITARF